MCKLKKVYIYIVSMYLYNIMRRFDRVNKSNG